ncbi:unnamed protein product [Lota lota]
MGLYGTEGLFVIKGLYGTEGLYVILHVHITATLAEMQLYHNKIRPDQPLIAQGTPGNRRDTSDIPAASSAVMETDGCDEECAGVMNVPHIRMTSEIATASPSTAFIRHRPQGDGGGGDS